MHLQCNRGAPFPACLNWFKICDDKVDCIDGEFDEKDCDQLEINECENNEYRCHNGQCISEDFFRDNILNPDCLDGTDELAHEEYPSLCTYDPTIGTTHWQTINIYLFSFPLSLSRMAHSSFVDSFRE
jgi:hypothetical protein